MISQTTNIRFLILTIMTAVILSGCSFIPKQQYKYSDETSYLYPQGVNTVTGDGVSIAALPLRIGIAFVPDTNSRGPDSALLEQQKMQLMETIKQQLLNDPMIGKIELIPSSYLSAKGSFNDLDKIRSVFGVDTIFLLFFEQAQYTDRGLLSLGYWTIIGAYFIPGEKNDTHSMISAVAYDIPQRQLLFRTQGISRSKELSTPINHSQEIREERIKGFKKAAKNLTKNLDTSLEEFKNNLVVTTPGLKVIVEPTKGENNFWTGR